VSRTRPASEGMENRAGYRLADCTPRPRTSLAGERSSTSCTRFASALRDVEVGADQNVTVLGDCNPRSMAVHVELFSTPLISVRAALRRCAARRSQRCAGLGCRTSPSAGTISGYWEPKNSRASNDQATSQRRGTVAMRGTIDEEMVRRMSRTRTCLGLRPRGQNDRAGRGVTFTPVSRGMPSMMTDRSA